jgi:single-strand DNA-binding protein
MLNQVQLIGHIKEVLRSENGELSLVLAVERSFKNNEGKFLTDYLTCRVWKAVVDVYENICREGQLVSLSGRLESLDGKKIGITCTYVDFLK